MSGIKVKRQAKYLGVNYNVDLSIKYSLRRFKAKIQYVNFRLYRLIRMADFRTRFNLWQVFIMPLIRMVISTVGEWKSKRCEEAFELIQRFIRTTMRRMTCAPRNASSEVFDYISGWNKERFINLIREMDDSVTKTTRVRFIDEDLMFSPSSDWLTALSGTTTSKIKSVHPEIDPLLRLINNYKCKQHPDKVISFNHLG